MRTDCYPVIGANKRTYTRFCKNLMAQVREDEDRARGGSRLNFRARFVLVPDYLLAYLLNELYKHQFIILSVTPRGLVACEAEVGELRDYQVIAVAPHHLLTPHSSLAVQYTYLDLERPNSESRPPKNIWESIGQYTDAPEPEWQA